MQASQSQFQRRLRLLLAQEFAARGYFLDAEGFFHQVPVEDLDAEELALLAKVALAAKNQKQAVSRFERLVRLQPTNQEAKGGLLAAESLKRGVWQRLKSVGKFAKPHGQTT
jgi:Flp pilus assembly protein TadD